MTTITLELDDETVERLCERVKPYGGSVEGLLQAIVRQFSMSDPTPDPLWGKARDNAEQEEEILAQIMKDRRDR